MRQILEFTDNSFQTMQIPLEDKSGQASLTLYWCPTQLSWYFDFRYNNLTCNGLKLCLGPNLLRMFKNVIPFGLMVVSDDCIEPHQITDLSSQRVKIFILNSTEVLQFERLVYNE